MNVIYGRFRVKKNNTNERQDGNTANDNSNMKRKVKNKKPISKLHWLMLFDIVSISIWYRFVYESEIAAASTLSHPLSYLNFYFCSDR